MLARFSPSKGSLSPKKNHEDFFFSNSREYWRDSFHEYRRESWPALLLFFFTSRAIRDFSIMVNAYDF
jgi:hypothetical protein